MGGVEPARAQVSLTGTQLSWQRGGWIGGRGPVRNHSVVARVRASWSSRVVKELGGSGHGGDVASPRVSVNQSSLPCS